MDGGQLHPGFVRFGSVLVVFAQAAIAAKPRNGAFDNPSLAARPIHGQQCVQNLTHVNGSRLAWTFPAPRFYWDQRFNHHRLGVNQW
ncbi:MAG: hypothetical protein KatS3mg057_1031 [Herpetosiphonaceae bacterium]|nr:MAG: hypothetical protein KatS3mg057_1031 [Herpetosiphonaceae bacterium]